MRPLGIILAKSCREEAELLTVEEREIISKEELCAYRQPHIAAGGDRVRGVKWLVREKISEALLERVLRV